MSKPSEGFAILLESQREILSLREQVCDVQLKRFQLWVSEAKDHGATEVAEILKENVMQYFEQEKLSLSFLKDLLNALQRSGSEKLARLELSNANSEH